MITVFLGPDECRAVYAGPYVGGPLNGSFVMYVCDEPRGHDPAGGHLDSALLFGWFDPVEAPRLALAGSNPTV